jgi:transcription elongation factor Elf1
MLRDIDRNDEMTGVDALMIRFQCPKCGNEIEQTIGRLTRGDHIRCGECGVGINVDTNRLANAAKEMRSAMEKVPPEITIKFFR